MPATVSFYPFYHESPFLSLLFSPLGISSCIHHTRFKKQKGRFRSDIFAKYDLIYVQSVYAASLYWQFLSPAPQHRLAEVVEHCVHSIQVAVPVFQEVADDDIGFAGG